MNYKAELAQEIKRRRKEKKISQEVLGAKVNISKSAISLLENGNQFPSDDTLKKICDFLNIEVNEDRLSKTAMVNFNNSTLPKINQEKGVPYYDIDFIGGYDLVFNEQTINPAFYIDFLPFNDADCWINVSGKSMGPLIAHGDIVALKEVPDWKRFLLEGEIYAVITDNGFRTIKMIGAGPDKDHYMLIPYNKSEEYRPQAIPKEVITHIFRVKGAIKKFF